MLKKRNIFDAIEKCVKGGAVSELVRIHNKLREKVRNKEVEEGMLCTAQKAIQYIELKMEEAKDIKKEIVYIEKRKAKLKTMIEK